MFKRMFAVVFLLLVSVMALASSYHKLKVGDVAPVFKVDKFNLAKLKGKPVVLYFYPKDWTAQCTIEAKDFRDHFKEFQELDTQVVGVSSDDQESHIGFKDEYDLPFELVSDTKKIAKKYGVKGFLWNRRATFLIDRQGKIAYAWYKVDVENHVKDVLQKIKDLKL